MRRTIGHVGIATLTLPLLVAGSALASITTTGPFEWKVSDGGNGHFYELVMPDKPDDSANGYSADSFTWEEARVAAESSVHLGSAGHLVSVTSAGENEFLRSQFASLIFETPGVNAGPHDIAYAWIGLFAPTPTANLEWTTGESVSYTNWAPSEPNFYGQDLWQYTHYWNRDFGNGPSWTWNNERNEGYSVFENNRYGYIAEYDSPLSPVPEPAAVFVWSLLGLCGIGCGCWRNRKM